MTYSNDPAFAQSHQCGKGCPEVHGLTKREYFSALAMQALLGIRGDIKTEEGESVCRAFLAVLSADTLIAELNKEKK